MDDAYVRTDTGELLLSFPYVRTGARLSGAVPYMTGFLFRDVRIPRGADITSAKLVVQPFGYQSGVPVSVDIRGDLRPQSNDFNPNNVLLHLRPRTAASVLWNLNSIVTQPAESSEVSVVVEEIVSQPGWQAGNNLAIFLDAHQTTAQYIDWFAYDYSPAEAARLIVRYQWSNGPTATPTSTPTPHTAPTLSIGINNVASASSVNVGDSYWYDVTVTNTSVSASLTRIVLNDRYNPDNIMQCVVATSTQNANTATAIGYNGASSSPPVSASAYVEITNGRTNSSASYLDFNGPPVIHRR